MKLRHFYIKVSLFGLLLLFCILFGVSLASSGMERIQGPQPSAKAAVQEPVKPAGEGDSCSCYDDYGSCECRENNTICITQR